MKETLHRRAHTTRFHVDEILQQTEVTYGGKQIRTVVAPGGPGWELSRTRYAETPWAADTVLQLIRFELHRLRESSLKIWAFYSMYILP